jgi:hypothetical protein
MTTPRGTRSLLRRPVRGELSALATTPALRPEDRTRRRHESQRPDVRAPVLGQGRRPSPARRAACAPAVASFPRAAKALLACALVTGALWSVTAARADETPPPSPTPTTTTPDAPPPDPYKAPAKSPPQSSKPKTSPRPPTRSAPAAPVRQYTPPVSRPSTPTYNAPTYTAPTYRAPTYRAPVTRAKTHRVAKKAVDKPRKRAVHRRTKANPAPVTVTLAPMAHVLAAAKVPLPVASTSDSGRDPYLWLAGLAFALLAVAGLSLHLLSVRVFHVRFE